MTNIYKDKKAIFSGVAIVAVLVGIFALAGLSSPASSEKPGADNRLINASDYPEAQEIQSKNIASFTELAKYFTELADKKGGEYAFRVLAIAPIPPNIDMHLLAHTVGDELYKQQGIDGIKICTQDFRNACSHSIVVGLLLEKGEGDEVITQITDTCKQAPGGSGAYTMCFHGLGHGILAYTGYDLPKAIELCDKTGTPEYRDREAIECMGGTIMEIVGGGFHNPELYEIQSKKYLSSERPLEPCSADFMPDKAKAQCYNYLTPHLWIAVGGNIGSPTPQDFEKAFVLCEQIPENEPWNRGGCFGGFGKEFVVLAKARNVQKIDQMTVAEMSKVIEWCNLAADKLGVGSCLNSAESSLYWGGENDRSAVIKFCELQDSFGQERCFTNAINMVEYYISDNKYRDEFCAEIPAQYEEQCRGRLLPA